MRLTKPQRRVLDRFKIAGVRKLPAFDDFWLPNDTLPLRALVKRGVIKWLAGPYENHYVLAYPNNQPAPKGPPCGVTSDKFDNCPETAVWKIDPPFIEILLCERCRTNVLTGAYGERLRSRAMAAVRIQEVSPL